MDKLMDIWVDIQMNAFLTQFAFLIGELEIAERLILESVDKWDALNESAPVVPAFIDDFVMDFLENAVRNYYITNFGDIWTNPDVIEDGYIFLPDENIATPFADDPLPPGFFEVLEA